MPQKLAGCRIEPPVSVPVAPSAACAATAAAELSHILTWVEQLAEVDTADVAPMTSVAAMRLPMRDDAVTDGNRRAEILQNAPQAARGFFAVPKVVE